MLYIGNLYLCSDCLNVEQSEYHARKHNERRHRRYAGIHVFARTGEIIKAELPQRLQELAAS